jgi:predicted nucleic acid-binding Zn finger protein
MRDSSEVKILDEICARSRESKLLSERDLGRLSEIFGKRFRNAWEAVQERRVKRYRFVPSGKVVWIVVGRERDYQVLPKVEFCTCDDFYFKVMEHEAHLCYHLIAQRLADCLEMYDNFEESDELLETLMREWRYRGPDS